MAAVPVLILYLVLCERDKKYALLATAIGAVTAGAIFLPFLIRDPEVLWWDIYGFRTIPYSTFPLLPVIVSKLQLVYMLAAVFFPFHTVVLARGIASFLIHYRRRLREALARNPIPAYLAGSTMTVSLANFLPWVPLAEYQIINLPIIAVLSGYAVSKWYEASALFKGKVATLALVGALLFLGVVNQSRSIWVGAIDLGDSRLPLAEVSEVASYIEKSTRSDKPIFTYRTYLAVQSHRKVLPGLEMAAFSYFPEWDTAKARRYHVTNDEIVREYIASKRASAIVLTDFDFTQDAFSVPLNPETQQKVSKDLANLIAQGYYLGRKTENFGQFKETVYVYLRKPE